MSPITDKVSCIRPIASTYNQQFWTGLRSLPPELDFDVGDGGRTPVQPSPKTATCFWDWIDEMSFIASRFR